MDKAAIMEALQDAKAALEALDEALQSSFQGVGDPPPLKPFDAKDFLAGNATWEQEYMSISAVLDGWCYCVDWSEGMTAYPVPLGFKEGDDMEYDDTRGLGFWVVRGGETGVLEWQPVDTQQ